MSSFVEFESDNGVWQEEGTGSISSISNTDASTQNVPSYAVPRIIRVFLDEGNNPTGCTEFQLQPLPIKYESSTQSNPLFKFCCFGELLGSNPLLPLLLGMQEVNAKNYFQWYSLELNSNAIDFLTELSRCMVFGTTENLWRYVYCIAFDFYCRHNRSYCRAFRHHATGAVFYLLSPVVGNASIRGLEQCITAEDVYSFWAEQAMASSAESFCHKVASLAFGIDIQVPHAPTYLGLHEMCLRHLDDEEKHTRSQEGLTHGLKTKHGFKIEYGERASRLGLRAYRSVNFFPKMSLFKVWGFLVEDYVEWMVDLAGQFATVSGTRHGFSKIRVLMDKYVPTPPPLDAKKAGKGIGLRRTHGTFWAFVPYASISASTLPRRLLSTLAFHCGRRSLVVSDQRSSPADSESKQVISTGGFVISANQFYCYPNNFEAMGLAIPQDAPYIFLYGDTDTCADVENKPEWDPAECVTCRERLADVPFPVALYIHMHCCQPDQLGQKWWALALSAARGPVPLCVQWTKFFRKELFQHATTVVKAASYLKLRNLIAVATAKCSGVVPVGRDREHIIRIIARVLVDGLGVPSGWKNNFTTSPQGTLCGVKQQLSIRRILSRDDRNFRFNGIDISNHGALRELASELRVRVPVVKWDYNVSSQPSEDDSLAIACLLYGHYTWHWRWFTCLFASFLELPEPVGGASVSRKRSRVTWEASLSNRRIDPSAKRAMKATWKFVQAVNSMPSQCIVTPGPGSFSKSVPPVPIIHRSTDCVIGNVVAGPEYVVIAMACRAAMEDYPWVMACAFACKCLRDDSIDLAFLGCVQCLGLQGLLFLGHLGWSVDELRQFDADAVAAMFVWVLNSFSLRESPLFRYAYRMIEDWVTMDTTDFISRVRAYLVSRCERDDGCIPLCPTDAYDGVMRLPPSQDEWRHFSSRFYGQSLRCASVEPSNNVAIYDFDVAPPPEWTTEVNHKGEGVEGLAGLEELGEWEFNVED